MLSKRRTDWATHREIGSLFEFADVEMHEDRNYQSCVPEIAGYNVFDWTIEQVCKFLRDNGHSVKKIVEADRESMLRYWTERR